MTAAPVLDDVLRTPVTNMIVGELHGLIAAADLEPADMYIRLFREGDVVLAAIPDCVTRLAEAGVVDVVSEQPAGGPGNQYMVRLAGHLVVEKVLTEDLLSRWADNLGERRYTTVLATVCRLLAQYATDAVEVDAQGAFRVAAERAFPDMPGNVARVYGQRVVEHAYNEDVDLAGLLKAMVSIGEFSGTTDELVKTSAAVIAAPS